MQEAAYLPATTLQRIWGTGVARSRSSLQCRLTVTFTKAGRSANVIVNITEDLIRDVTSTSGEKGRMWCLLADQCG